MLHNPKSHNGFFKILLIQDTAQEITNKPRHTRIKNPVEVYVYSNKNHFKNFNCSKFYSLNELKTRTTSSSKYPNKNPFKIPSICVAIDEIIKFSLKKTILWVYDGKNVIFPNIKVKLWIKVVNRAHIRRYIVINV